MSFVDPVRVCEECEQITRQESEFFDKGIKILMNGEIFLFEMNENYHSSKKMINGRNNFARCYIFIEPIK